MNAYSQCFALIFGVMPVISVFYTLSPLNSARFYGFGVYPSSDNFFGVSYSLNVLDRKKLKYIIQEINCLNIEKSQRVLTESICW